MWIYKTICLANGKIYVGQDARKRPSYLGSGVWMKRAIEKYGRNNFKKEILCECSTKEELDAKEIEFIALYNSTDPKIGYNISKGGGGPLGVFPNEESRKKMAESHRGSKRTEETKARMSEANRRRYERNPEAFKGENHGMYGKTHSEESKKKMSERRKAHLAVPENKEKMVESLKKRVYDPNRVNPMQGKTGEKHHLYGKKLSEETKQKISKAHQGKVGPRGEDNPNYGRKASEETKQKMRETHKKRFAENPAPTGKDHPHYGKKHSEETRQKKSAALKRYWQEKKAKNNLPT